MARIFVVEDDASLRDELMRLLELQGHTPLTSTAFDRVADDVLAEAPDCVILDLKLPGTGGHTVCRDLRRASQVPIIMLTSSDSEFDEVMSMNLGADDYVTKPYNPAVLLARIQSVLRRSQSAEPLARIAHRGVVLDVARAGGWSTTGAPSTSRATSSRYSTCSWRTTTPSSRARSSWSSCGSPTRSSTTTR